MDAEATPETADDNFNRVTRVPHRFSARPEARVIEGTEPALHYLDWPAAAGAQVLLFLHGGGLTAHTWDVVCDLLQPRFHSIAVDLRGHGDSGWSTDGHYPIADHVGDIDRVVEHLSLDEFVLVGMSLGGTAGLLWAGRKPSGLAGLVLVDTGYGFRTPSRRIRDFMSGPSEGEFDEFVERSLAFNPRRSREQLRHSLRNSLRQLPEGKWTWKYDRRSLSGPAVDIVQLRESLRAAAGNVECPTLVIRGGESDMFNDEDAASLAALIPGGSWRRIDGAGHSVQADRPRELASALTSFATDGKLGSRA